MFTQKKFSIFTFGSRTKLLDVWMIVHKEGMLLMTASYRPSSFWCSFFVGSSLRWTSDVASKCRYYISALHWWLVVDPGFIWPSLLSSNSMNSAVLPCSSAALEWSNRKAPICLLVRFIASQTLSLLPKWKWSINSCLYKTNHAVATPSFLDFLTVAPGIFLRWRASRANDEKWEPLSLPNDATVGTACGSVHRLLRSFSNKMRTQTKSRPAAATTACLCLLYATRRFDVLQMNPHRSSCS